MCSSDVNITTVVKIKDIIRWKSFRDIVVEPSLPPPPLDFMVGSTNTTCSSCSSGSSWTESDFFLTSSWEEPQNDNVEAGKRFSFFSPLVVGKDSRATVSNYLLQRIFTNIRVSAVEALMFACLSFVTFHVRIFSVF